MNGLRAMRADMNKRMHAHLATLLVAIWIVFVAPIAKAFTEPVQLVTQHLKIGQHDFAIKVPRGFAVEHLTAAMSAPRLLTFHDNGDLFVGSRSGDVYRLSPPYDQPRTLMRVNGYPHSVAFRGKTMLVALTDGLHQLPYQPGDAPNPASIQLLAKIPGGRGHDSRTVKVGPDGRIYLSLGIRGNCNDEYIDASYPADRRRGGVMVLDETAKPPVWKPFATGLRNPVGLAWHPDTQVAYATNNGPDHLGFEHPAEVFARLDASSFHGMPWFHWRGDRLQRDNCISSKPPRPAASVVRPAATFPARNAPMDVVFAHHNHMAGEFAGDAVVALRGSWATLPNSDGGADPASRRPPKIVLVRFNDGRAIRVEDFVTGFQLADGRRWARPVGVAFGPDGMLYFTSDSALEGLYRLRATGD